MTLDFERMYKVAIDSIAVLLPMAKGYASEHDVGNNKKIVEEIEERFFPQYEEPFISEDGPVY